MHDFGYNYLGETAEFNRGGDIDVKLRGKDNYITKNNYTIDTCTKSLSIMGRIVELLKSNITHTEIDAKILLFAEDDVIKAIENNASASQIENLCRKVENYAKQCGLETNIRDRVAKNLEFLNIEKLREQLREQKKLQQIKRDEEHRATMNSILTKYGFNI